jgi:hypothetical protein
VTLRNGYRGTTFCWVEIDFPRDLLRKRGWIRRRPLLNNGMKRWLGETAD